MMMMVIVAVVVANKTTTTTSSSSTAPTAIHLVTLIRRGGVGHVQVATSGPSTITRPVSIVVAMVVLLLLLLVMVVVVVVVAVRSVAVAPGQGAARGHRSTVGHPIVGVHSTRCRRRCWCYSVTVARDLGMAGVRRLLRHERRPLCAALG